MKCAQSGITVKVKIYRSKQRVHHSGLSVKKSHVKHYKTFWIDANSTVALNLADTEFTLCSEAWMWPTLRVSCGKSVRLTVRNKSFCFLVFFHCHMWCVKLHLYIFSMLVLITSKIYGTSLNHSKQIAFMSTNTWYIHLSWNQWRVYNINSGIYVRPHSTLHIGLINTARLIYRSIMKHSWGHRPSLCCVMWWLCRHRTSICLCSEIPT